MFIPHLLKHTRQDVLNEFRQLGSVVQTDGEVGVTCGSIRIAHVDVHFAQGEKGSNVS